MSGRHQPMKAYFVGGGIASLAGAVFLIRDGKVPPEDIVVLEELDILGGSLDGRGSPGTGYSMRGGRMFNFTYYCTYDLLAAVPSLSDPSRSVRDEIIEFNNRVKTNSHCRLVRGGSKVDSSVMGFNLEDRLQLGDLIVIPEHAFWGQQIDEHFDASFFETNFWSMWATMFGFQPWHSLVEFRRYLHRFIHEFPHISTLAGVDRTPYNQYDSIVLPISRWLRGLGVRFEMGCQATDVDFQFAEGRRQPRGIHFTRDGKDDSIPLTEDDLLFVTLGMHDRRVGPGFHELASPLNSKHDDGGAWTCGRTSAEACRLRRSLGLRRQHRGVEVGIIHRHSARSHLLPDDGSFTGNAAGTGGLVTFMDSNWLMSVVLAYQPHFINQPEDVFVFWGYGLFVDSRAISSPSRWRNARARRS